MLKDYIGKIRTLLNQNTSLVPYCFETFYCALKCLASNIPGSEVSHSVVEKFSSIYNFYKIKLKEEKLEADRKKIYSQLSDFLLPFRKYITKQDVLKSIIENFDNVELLAFFEAQLAKSRQIEMNYLKKNNKIHVKGNHQLSHVFWVNTFKAEYAVHFDIFWDGLVNYLCNLSFFDMFISESSKSRIQNIVDPDRKFYVNSANANDFFIKLSEPEFLRALAEQTSLKQKPPKFTSFKDLHLLFKIIDETMIPQTKVIHGSRIVVNGQAVQLDDTMNKHECRYSPTIRFGALPDSEIFIKNDYISRRQFMLIEEEKGYSLVCLSPSNFTSITYPYEIKVKPGMIFRVNGQMLQITKISEVFSGFTKHLSQDPGDDKGEDKTLEYLPENKSFLVEKEVQYKYLTGNRKNQKRVLNSNNDSLQFSEKSIKLHSKEGNFFLPGNVEILAKTANQVISGHLSDKILLEEGMKIVLQGVSFEIL